MKPTAFAPGPAAAEEVVAAVRSWVGAHAQALRGRGFSSLALFGSVVRGDVGAESDVDVLYTFAPGRSSLAAVLDVQEALEGVTGRPVQMVSWRHLHPLLRDRILGEAEPLLDVSGAEAD